MLGKLLKYELPAMGRKLLPLYIAWLAASILLGFGVRGFESESDLLPVLTILLYVAVTVAVFVMSIILIIQRYRTSMLGDEAYFNMVLPVSMNEHIANKGLSALIWMSISAVASFISIFLILLCSGALFDVLPDFLAGIREMIAELGPEWVLVIVEIFLLGILSSAKSILAIYAAITIGHQAKDHTTLASIGAYIGLSMAETAVGNILVQIGMVVNLGFDDFIKYMMAHNFLSAQLIFLILFIVAAALVTAYFFICKYFMERKLNLN